MNAQVLEGVWEEILQHSEELAGKRMRVLILSEPSEARQPNMDALAVMQRVAEIQRGMNPKPGSDSVQIIREGRAGALYELPADAG